MKEKEMIPNGFNSKIEASNNQNDYGAIDMKVIFLVDGIVRGIIAMYNRILALLKVPWQIKG